MAGLRGFVFLPNANVFIPKVRSLRNEVAHHLDAFIILNDIQLHSLAAEPVFGAKECLIFANDDSRNFVEERSSTAHRTW
jgi:hypothetical protein